MYELCVYIILSNGYGVSFFEYFSYYTGFSGRGMCVDVCVCVFLYFIWHCIYVTFIGCFCQSLGNGFMIDNCISEWLMVFGVLCFFFMFLCFSPNFSARKSLGLVKLKLPANRVWKGRKLVILVWLYFFRFFFFFFCCCCCCRWNGKMWEKQQQWAFSMEMCVSVVT